MNLHPFLEPPLGRVYVWIKLIALTGFSQILVQGIAFVTGIFIIRILPIEEYALYTSMYTIISTMIVLSDGGISSGTMGQGGKVWQDKNKLSVIIASGMALQKKMAIIVLSIAMPFVILYLFKYNVGLLFSVIIILSLSQNFIFSLFSILFTIPLKLNRDVKGIQYTLIQSGVIKLLLSFLLLVFYPNAAIALLCVSVSQTLSSVRLNILSYKYIDRAHFVRDHAVESEILMVFKRVMPASAYDCISGQLPVWILILFGSTTSVAQIGVLNRLNALLDIFGIIASTLVVPVFAKLHKKSKYDYLKRFFQIQSIAISLMVVLIIVTHLFKSEITSIFGIHYSNLSENIVTAMVANCIRFLSGSIVQICLVRKYLINPIFDIAFQFSTQAVALYVVDYSTVEGVLLYSIICSTTAYFLWTTVYIINVMRMREEYK